MFKLCCSWNTGLPGSGGFLTEAPFLRLINPYSQLQLMALNPHINILQFCHHCHGVTCNYRLINRTYSPILRHFRGLNKCTSGQMYLWACFVGGYVSGSFCCCGCCFYLPEEEIKEEEPSPRRRAWFFAFIFSRNTPNYSYF